MKNIRIICAVIVIVTVLLPVQTFAAWWNPLTWSVFQKNKPAQPRVESVATTTATPTIEIATTTPVVVKITETASSTPKPQPTPVVKPTPVVPATKPVVTPVVTPVTPLTLSPEDQSASVTAMKMFVAALRSKDAGTVNFLISSQSKAYFDNILTLSKTAEKEELLSQNFSTVFSVVLVRMAAASTTLDLQSKDLITRAVTLGAPAWFTNLDLNKLVIGTKAITATSAEAIAMIDGEEISRTRLVKENGYWKIDSSSLFTERNASIEQAIKTQSQKDGKTRAELMESLLKIFFGNSTEINYLTWVPLNQRSDLDANNIKFQGFTNWNGGFSLKFPDAWEIDTVDSTTFFLAPYSTDGIRSTIAVTYNMNPNSNNLDSYFDYFIKTLPTAKKDISGEVTQTKTTFLGQPAYKVNYKRLRTFNEGRTYVTQMNESLIIFRNNIAYLIEYRNGLAEFEEGKPLAEKIINTIKFGPICDKFCSTDMYDNN